MKFLGHKLRELREDRKLSMRQVEDLTGVKQASQSEYENNIKNPRPATIKRLCQGLNVPEEYFYIENAKLINDVLPNMPENLKKLIEQKESIPYLVVTEKAISKGISPDTLDRMIDLLDKK